MPTGMWSGAHLYSNASWPGAEVNLSRGRSNCDQGGSDRCHQKQFFHDEVPSGSPRAQGTLWCGKCFLTGFCDRVLHSSENLRMYKVGLVLILFLGTASAKAALPNSDELGGWSVFSDPRYGTRVEYPSWFSVSDGGPQLGTGQRLLTPDGRAEIEIYSLSNTAHYTPRSYLAAKMKIDPATLHYQRVTARFFALSTIPGAIFPRVVRERSTASIWAIRNRKNVIGTASSLT